MEWDRASFSSMGRDISGLRYKEDSQDLAKERELWKLRG
jgi:hypothetical protein